MTPQQPRPRIGLAMIVRDESDIIERCLGSVRPIIDTWTIVDTGSRDDTITRVQESLVGIPGTVHTRPWRDFSTNRNELLALARPTADYLLLLDADMTVSICATDPLSDLSAPVYDILVEAGLQYRMPYLLASTTECAFIGRTHEFLSFADSSTKPVHYDGIVLSHLADGGNRSTQLERDLNLLEDDAVTDPHNPRTMFYLAQTRENIGDSLGAIAAYRARIEMGGWDEEIFWSLYRSARLLEAAGDWPAAAQMYINAWEYRPHRLEPILQLARGYRESGAHRTALIWAELARGMVYPAGDRLFVERWMYDWGMDLELAACLWWNDEPVRASSIWTALLDRDDLSESTREAIRGNLALGA